MLKSTDKRHFSLINRFQFMKNKYYLDKILNFVKVSKLKHKKSSIAKSLPQIIGSQIIESIQTVAQFQVGQESSG